MSSTPYVQNLMLNYAFRNVTGSPPSAWYVALFNGDTEVAGTGYTRQSVTFLAPLAGIVRNGADVAFAAAAPDWLNITHYAIYDAATLGNQLGSGALADPITPDGINALAIAAGGIEISLG